MLDDVATALSVRYTVFIDNADLGDFSTCEGLGVEVVIESREEGGNNAFIWQVPTRLKYSNIKLSRPLGSQTKRVAAWFATVNDGNTWSNGQIEVMTADGQVIATWNLTGVIPVRWTGPTLNPDQPSVLMETVEIAHHGFTVAA